MVSHLVRYTRQTGFSMGESAKGMLTVDLARRVIFLRCSINSCRRFVCFVFRFRIRFLNLIECSSGSESLFVIRIRRQVLFKQY